MNIQPDETQQSISDDQELAKALAGVSADADKAATPQLDTQFEETGNPLAAAAAEVNTETDPDATPVTATVPTPVASAELETVKQDALQELRPLIDKLDLPPEEKFETYLLLLRSTDDETLVAPAHETAKLIADESQKAKALLNIVKEIDYLANKNNPQAA